MTRTSIIVSNLSKNDFVAEYGHTLSLANQIKLAILNLPPVDSDDFVHSIVHWSELAFLSRIIIIFKTPAAASRAYKFLEAAYNGEGSLTLPVTVKLSLQENLLLQSKLSDALNESKELNTSTSLELFREFHNAGLKHGDLYEEPKPQPFNAYADLKRLGIDVSEFNTEEQLQEMRDASESTSRDQSPGSLPPSRMGRSKSITQTLFKPQLSVDTTASATRNEQKSPTITLEETF